VKKPHWQIWPRAFTSCVALLGTFLVGSAPAGDISAYELTVRSVLEVVGAFRAAYVLHVVEHAREGGVTSREDWEKDPHYLPLPAQFVKAAAKEVRGLDIGLIGMNPLNKANFPKTAAESDALIRLSGQRDLRVLTFSDGDYVKGIAADLAIVQSCVDCHNAHPQAVRRNFQRWDLMGGVVVRLKPGALEAGFQVGPAVPERPLPTDRPLSPMTTPPPWVR
jgi:hypothetical protein